MEMKLFFGKSKVSLDVPKRNLMAVLEPKEVPPIYDVENVVRKSLDAPIACERIEDLVTHKMKVVVLCDDYTRKTPASLILPAILNKLKKAGLERKNIKIIMALGTHRPATEKEMEEKVGEEVYEEYEVLNHDWRNEEELVNLGKTRSGVPIQINKHVMDSDCVLGVGVIVPHRVSGFSGGSKIIQPGVCGAAITGYTHWLSAKFTGEEILGKIMNPVRAELDEVAKKTKLRFIVNVVLDRFGDMCGVFAGDFKQAFISGARLSKNVYKAEMPEKADIVVCDCPYPTSIELWQAAKSIYAVDLAVKPGGTIVFLSPCPEGVAKQHPEVEFFGYRPYNEVKGMVERNEIKDLAAAAHLVHVGRVIREKATCILISEGIDERTAKKIGFKYASTPEEGLSQALDRHGSDARIVVMKNSPDLLPVVK